MVEFSNISPSPIALRTGNVCLWFVSLRCVLTLQKRTERRKGGARRTASFDTVARWDSAGSRTHAASVLCGGVRVDGSGECANSQVISALKVSLRDGDGI